MRSGYRHTQADNGRIVAALEVKLHQFLGESDLASGAAWLQPQPDEPVPDSNFGGRAGFEGV